MPKATVLLPNAIREYSKKSMFRTLYHAPPLYESRTLTSKSYEP